MIGDLIEKHWALHYGMRATYVGEDGDVVVCGHRRDRRRIVAAISRLHRTDVGERLGLHCRYDDIAGDLEERWAVFIDRCVGSSDSDHPDDCWTCAEIKASDWWLQYGGVDRDAPGAFPITLWRA